jgi:ADP-ribosylglycohydrolase
MASLKDKVRGCLLASAIGNAMGSPVENWNYRDIEAKYGRIDRLLDPDRLELEDDNRIGLLLCQAYLEKGGPVTPEDLAKIWLREMDPKQFFWCLRNSYELLKSGVSPRLTGAHNIVTGSAIMAIAPVGLYDSGDPDRAYVDALQIGYMYQPRLDTECAAVIAACVAEAMRPDATAARVLEVALDVACDETVTTFDERELTIRGSIEKAYGVAENHDDVFEARSEIYEELLQWHPIDPVEVLSLTLCIFKIAKGDMLASVLGGVNIGRDSDTIANLCGALSGCLHGVGAVPPAWLGQVKKESLDAFTSVADRMASLVSTKAAESRQRSEALLSIA